MNLYKHYIQYVVQRMSKLTIRFGRSFLGGLLHLGGRGSRGYFGPLGLGLLRGMSRSAGELLALSERNIQGGSGG